ncbi:hypothetical protein ACYZT4_13920 [Pseudomonas sp. GB2N2]
MKIISVVKALLGYFWWLLIPLFPFVAFLFWQIAVLPNATIHFSRKGEGEFKYVWNVQHRIYRGRVSPGGAISDRGFLFPDEKFFMEISWWRKGVRMRCVNITPKWPDTNVYLDENGNVDTRQGSGTDTDRLKRCMDGSTTY